MADIYHDFLISALPARVFEAITVPSDLEKGWTVQASGEPEPGAIYELGFGPAHDRRAVVRTCVPDAESQRVSIIAFRAIVRLILRL